MNIKKILVTGGTGFIGNSLIPELLKQNYEVFSLQNSSLVSDSLKATIISCDINDALSIRNVVQKIAPDVVIHLAGISPVGYSYDHPQEVIQSNLIGTVNLAEACLHGLPDLKQFLFASTSETYGNGNNPKREEMTPNPNSPYAVSKLSCENYLNYLYNAYSFPVTILRNFNTYGRTQNINYVVERAIWQMVHSSSEILMGDPTPTRDFMYLADHVSSYLSCLGNDNAIGEVLNFCTGRSVSIKELVDIISDLVGFEGKISWYSMPKRPLDIQMLVGDYSKAKRKLGWFPRYTLEEGLKLTIQALAHFHH